MKTAGIILAALAAVLMGNKSGSTVKTGVTPLVTPGGGTTTPPGGDIFKDWTTKPNTSSPTLPSTLKAPTVAAAPTTPGLTGLTIKNLTAPVTSTRIATPRTFGSSTGFTWNTPQGKIESRTPTPEEEESGLGCPEVPGIWTYPGQSQQDLRYCNNPECPSNLDPARFDRTIDPGTVPITPAVLEDQGADAPQGKRWYCRVCRTYQP